MKRLILPLAAAAAIAAALPFSSAVAGDGGRHGDRGGGQGWAQRGGEGRGGGAWAGPRGGDRGNGRVADRPRYEPPPRNNYGERPNRGNEGRGNEGRGPEGRIPVEAPPPPREDGRWEARRDDPYNRPAEAPRSYGVRRGAYLPPEGGRAVQNHNAYGLRAPPPGYTWVATPRGYALVNQATGQVFDVVPGR